ncbi:MAG: hypothetical protein ABJF10_04150 [Chthoniobacter sp.]|uniref:hypothetical protein n=1 Tax=Chthoniobacter sp. TaxID=2510640 RepID=UPI0032A69F1B
MENPSAVLPAPSVVLPPPLPVPHPQPAPRPEPLPEFPVPKPGSLDLNEISRQGDRNDAALLCVIAGLAIAIFSPIDPPALRLLPLVVYPLIGLGIWKKSRIAAAVGLLMGVANVLMLLAIMTKIDPAQSKIAIGLLFVTGYWTRALYRSLLGTFAYHRQRSPRSCKSIPAAEISTAGAACI